MKRFLILFCFCSVAIIGSGVSGVIAASHRAAPIYTVAQLVDAPPPPIPVPYGHPIRFPADTAAHPADKQEWWYTVGHLTDAQGRTYGFETTIAKIGGLTALFPGTAEDMALHTDVSVTDDAAGRFYGAMRYMAAGRDALSPRPPLQARAANASITATGTGFQYRLTGAVSGARIDLSLVSQRPPLLVGGGLIPWGDGYSYYYSLTNLKATGTLALGHRRIAVQGIAWMDHQWGNWTGLGAQPTGVKHWEWMGMQLGDGTALNLAVLDTVRGIQGATSALLSDNRQVNLRGVKITDLGHWRSPHTGTVYPSGWRLQIPQLHLDVTVQPTVRDQELVDDTAVYGYRVHYWEGRCRVVGTRAGKPVRGQSYTELIGYGTPPTSPSLTP